MQERVVDIATRDGKMNTYVFHPDGPGPHPVVIHYMDSVGVREELSDMCRRLATVGYYVLLPNLYYRKARCVDLDADRLRDPAYVYRLAGVCPDRIRSEMCFARAERHRERRGGLHDGRGMARARIA